jgi:hypothetical protein
MNYVKTYTRLKMLSQILKEKLKSNWGDKANALDCYAEVKLIDPLSSSWACYIFAMNEDEELIHCLLYSNAIGPEIYKQSISDIYAMYNEEGENPVIDTEYRRTRVTELIRRLRHDT